MDIALQIAWEFYLDPPVDSTEEFHNIGERLMTELLQLEKCNQGVHDSAVSTEHDRGVVLVELLVVGEDLVPTIQKALDVVRTAIHAVEGATPTWPTAHDLIPVEFRTGEINFKRVAVPALV